MRTLLICHHDAVLDRDGLARWLGSFSTFVGAVVIREPNRQLRRRIRREIARVGWWRFLDVVAFRLWHAVSRRRQDRQWIDRALRHLHISYPDGPRALEIVVPSPNGPDAEQFIRERRPE